jgi:hypothetical protein
MCCGSPSKLKRKRFEIVRAGLPCAELIELVIANYVAEIANDPYCSDSASRLAPLLLTLKEALIKSRLSPEMPCVICSKPVDLSVDLAADGKR